MRSSSGWLGGVLLALGACTFDTSGISRVSDASPALDADGQAPASDADAGGVDSDTSRDRGVDVIRIPPPPGEVSPGGWVKRSPLLSQQTLRLISSWASSPTDVWVGGEQGHLLHYDGDRWRKVSCPALTEPITGIHGSAADDVWIVDSSGVVVRYDGSKIGQVAKPAAAFQDVWSFGPSDVVAVGEKGAVLRFDGASWSPAKISSSTLRAIWGRTPSAIWVVGDSGTARFFDGNNWSDSAAKTPENLQGIWGASSSEVWAVGDGGTVIRFNGKAWSVSSPAFPTKSNLTAIWGNGASDLWVGGAGGALKRFDGMTWINHDRASSVDVATGLGAGNKEVWAAGNAGALYRHDGAAWQEVFVNVPSSIHALSGPPIWITGNQSQTYREAAGGFVADVPTTGGVNLHAIHVTAAGDVWVGGDASRVASKNGTAWSPHDAADVRVQRFWTPSQAPTDVWMVGDAGPNKIFRRQNNQWVLQTVAGGAQYSGIWGTSAGNIWAVGTGGAIHRFDGATWAAAAAPGSHSLFAVWGVSAKDVWAVGDSGTILSFDGAAWTAEQSGTVQPLEGVWGRSSSEVYAVGSAGVILLFDGAIWSPEDSGSKESLTDIWGDGSRIVVGGSKSVILQKRLK